MLLLRSFLQMPWFLYSAVLFVSVPVAPSQSHPRRHNDAFAFYFPFHQTGHLLLHGRIGHPVTNVGHTHKLPACKHIPMLSSSRSWSVLWGASGQ
jgi:hypothetical protein